MTEPLTPDQDQNRIGSLWQGPKTDRPMLFHTGRPALPCHVAARIFPPSRSVMTSARGKTRPWRLIFERRTPPFIEPLMGYTGCGDTLTQVQLDFPTREAAIAFAERQKLDFVVQNSPPERPRPNVRKLLADPALAFSHPDTRRRTTTNREAEMASLEFPAPVKVRANGAVHDIETVRDAMAFLNQWPKNRRGPVFGCAERSCNAAIAGQVSAEQARQSFASFARIAGVLVDPDAFRYERAISNDRTQKTQAMPR